MFPPHVRFDFVERCLLALTGAAVIVLIAACIYGLTT
jgi:hypothetical protein